MSNDGIARSHILGRERGAVDGAVRGSMEGGTYAVVAEAMCAGCACHRFHERHATNDEHPVRRRARAILTDIYNREGLNLEGRCRHKKGKKRAKP
jgi:hypothetical protein